MARSRFSHLALLLSLVGGFALPAFAADNSGALDADSAGDVAGGLVRSNAAALAAPPSLAAFETLFTSFEQVRKWQAYVDANTAAKLDTSSLTFTRIAAAVAQLDAHHIDRVGLATAAIGKLAAIPDWHANDKAQADLVVEQLSELLTEITDPTQRITGQLVLARVELDSAVPEAALSPVKMALPNLAAVTDRATQADLARRMADVVFAVQDAPAVEIISEIVADIRDPADRSTLTDAFALKLEQRNGARLAAAAQPSGGLTPDPLGAAWAYHAARLNNAHPDFAATLASVRGDIDPLPTVVLLASGLDPAERQRTCAAEVDHLIAAGTAMRALNLRKMLPPADCGPGSGLAVAASLAGDRYDGTAQLLTGQYLAAVRNGYVPAAGELDQLQMALQQSGASALVADSAADLTRLLGADGYTALGARVAVATLLNGQAGAASDPAIAAAAKAYPAGAAMLALLTGGDSLPAAADFAAPDLDLLARIGARLADAPAAAPRLAAFLSANIALDAKRALADSLTGAPAFRLQLSSPLGAALQHLATTADDASLSASLGLLTADQLNAAGDPVLLRAARQAAWAGEADRASEIAGLAKDPASIRLAVAGITGVVGDFDAAMTAVRAEPDTANRASLLRFVAEQRVAMLAATTRLPRPATATVIPADFQPFGGRARSLSMAVSASADATPQAAPPMPDLTINSADVTAKIPFPVGGSGGIVVGGEGRYARLARFESPYFEDGENVGVRDYVYQQNKTITPEFIFLDAGTFTIADIIAAIGRDATDRVQQLPDGTIRLNRPIAIGPDATLILSGTEAKQIQLNATLGAYIVNAGHLFIDGVRIVAFDTVANAPARIPPGVAGNTFRPFILSWSASETDIADSELVALGYSAGRSYGLSLSSGPPDDLFARAKAAPPTGIIVNNSFDNLYYGFYAYEADSVQLVGNEYRNSVIYGIDPHDRSRRLNMSLNSSYGAFKKHGIIISRAVNDSFIVGNLSFDNHGSGVMLDRASLGTVIVGNTLRGNQGDGMAVFESPCTYIGGNDIGANQRSGVLVRNSWDVTVAGNAITGNHSAGVQGLISDLSRATGSSGRNFRLDPYQPFATVSVRGNTIAHNGAGIQMAGVSAADLFDNQFRYQSKRLFGGDLNGLAAVLLESGSHLPTTVSTGCRPVLTMPSDCVLTEIGAVLPMTGRFGTAASGSYCLGDPATPQAQAFNAGVH